MTNKENAKVFFKRERYDPLEVDFNAVTPLSEVNMCCRANRK